MARSRIAAAALVSTLALAGCGLGFDAGTQTQGPSRQMGTSVDTASLNVRSGNLVVDPAQPGRALFVGTLINPTDADNALAGVAADTTEVSEATVDGSAELPAGVPVQFGYNGGHSLVLTSATGEFTPGTYVTVAFNLATGDPVTVALLVKSATGEYGDVTVPSPAPTVTATPEPTPVPSAS